MSNHKSFAIGYCVGAAVAAVIFSFTTISDMNRIDQRLIDNGYAYYDSKTGDFVFHEKGVE